MDRTEQAIFTNMCMISDGAGNVLVEDRRNPNWPGLTFPGGHVEPGESFCASVVREVREETGLTIEHPVLCGIKQFPASDGGARYIVLFFKADSFSGRLAPSSEGDVFWLPRAELENRNLAPDFAEMLRVFEDDALSEFYYRKENNEWKIELL